MKFNQSSRKRTGKNGGYYLAVLLCLVAVGLVALSNFLDSKKESEAEDKNTDIVSESYDSLPSDDALNEMSGTAHGSELIYASTTDSAPTTAPAVAELSSSETSLPSTTTAPTEAVSSKNEPEAVEVSATPIIFTKPVTGQVFKEFSGNSLVYSETLGDWRVHNGTDIRCEYGSLVTSSAPGTVASVSEDDRYGTVVIIRHEDGSMLYYCGLDEVSVKDGDTVQSGQKLGTVGVIPCECEDEPHLHLMAMQNGEFVEPLSTFGISYGE